MKEKLVLACEIGSSCLRAMVARHGINNTFKVKGFKEVEYEGFYEGEFINKEKLPLIFENLLNELEIKGERIDKIYIGVPAEFSSVLITEESTNFGLRRRVKQNDIDNRYFMAGEKSKDAQVEIVSISPISYTLDGYSTIDPIGESGAILSVKLSIIYVNRKFIELFNTIASGLGFCAVEYLSEPLAQAQFLLPKEKREELTVIIDGGDLTTNIAFIKGEGLTALTSFSRGGAFITNDLAEAFELSLSEADRLKKQIVLSLKGGQNDCYELMTDQGNVVRISLNFANEVVGYRIDELSEVTAKCIQMNTRDSDSYLSIYLTGGGISKIKGGRDYLAKCLGKNVAYGVPNIPGKDKPELASIYSLINAALK